MDESLSKVGGCFRPPSKSASNAATTLTTTLATTIRFWKNCAITGSVMTARQEKRIGGTYSLSSSQERFFGNVPCQRTWAFPNTTQQNHGCLFAPPGATLLTSGTCICCQPLELPFGGNTGQRTSQTGSCPLLHQLYLRRWSSAAVTSTGRTFDTATVLIA